MSEAVSPTPLDPEDVARANLYGLVSRLFYAPADPNLLAEISRAPAAAEADEEPTALRRSWDALQEACRSAFPALVRQEYEGLFVGVGKAEVSPYLSAYAQPSAPERYLVRLRDQLAVWALARREGAFEVEDHVSGVSDVLRWLVETGRPLVDQRGFFETYLYPGAVPFCAAVQNAASVAFYKPVAGFAHAFLELEKAAFDMSDTEQSAAN
ncbi:MAG: TorD/DmsD family molecular chaperone [Betaproteobacteria bacterium]